MKTILNRKAINYQKMTFERDCIKVLKAFFNNNIQNYMSIDIIRTVEFTRRKDVKLNTRNARTESTSI